MILAFELTWTGATHIPINSAMLQIVAAACPGQVIRLHATACHLAQLACDPCFAACAAVETVAVVPADIHRGHTQIVSWTRFRSEFAIILAALQATPRGEACLIVLLSATSTAIWAAALASRIHGRGVGIQVLLHGNLNDAIGWRTRNPLLRPFDLIATLRSALPAPVRYIVFEPYIAAGLARIAPNTASVTDVIPHPVSLGDLPPDFDHYPRLGSHIHVGFVGQGTESKGFDIFLDVARQISADYANRITFHMIGKVQPHLMADALRTPLADPPTTEALSRDVFTGRLRRLDFVLLPFRTGYYELSASGGLLDAMAWLKPVIATDVPLTRGFTAAYGNIGYIAGDLTAIVRQIVTAMDATRYAAQVEAVRRVRGLRTPAALTPVYQTAVRAGFPAFSAKLR
jgi:glycosyltransferase involved in cell wall biosynthesis